MTEAPTTSKYAGPLCVTSPAGSAIEESRVRHPPSNGCPKDFDLIGVVQVESEGNRAARIADEFAGPHLVTTTATPAAGCLARAPSI